MRGSIMLERGWCHDSDVGTDYLFLLLSFPPTIVPSSRYPFVLNLDYPLFTHTR